MFQQKASKWNEKQQKLCGFSYTWNMINFKAFCWNISLSSNLLFLKSVYWNFCLWSWIFFIHLWILLKQEYLCSILQLADFYHLSMKIHEKNYHLVKVIVVCKSYLQTEKKKSVRELRIWTKGQACLNQIAIFKNIHM